MKNLVLLFLFTLGISNLLTAQIESNIEQAISINDSGDLPDSSAILDVNSIDRGVLIPRMSSTARLAITAPARGLTVYDTTMNVPCHYTGSIWRCILPPACATLDAAYDCGGPGMGRTIFVDTGAVTLLGSNALSSTLVVTDSSMVTASRFNQSGDGPVAIFHQQNPLSGINAVVVQNDGSGEGLRILTPNPMNPTSALDLDQGGLGNGASMITSNMMNTGLTLELTQMGLGGGALIFDQNPMDISNALTVLEDGFGVAGYFQTSNPLDTTPTIEVIHMGMDHAGYFETVSPMDSAETVYAINQGQGDGVRGVATTIDTFTKAGVVGTGMGKASVAAALEAHDGAIRVSKTLSPDTPADFFDINLVSWLPMEDCPAICSAPGASNVYAYNSDVIFIPNVYADPARSVIIHTVEQTDPSSSPLFFLRALTRTVVPGGFSVQFILDMNQCTGLCTPPAGLPVRLHYLIINK